MEVPGSNEAGADAGVGVGRQITDWNWSVASSLEGPSVSSEPSPMDSTEPFRR